jgi:hypothetical protein
LWGGFAGLLMLLSLTPAGAASANISHAYHATGSVSDGSIVSLDPERSDYVEPADSTNGARLLGVAVAGNDSLLAVDEGAGKVQIATSGTVSTLVSTLNGSIGVGDAVSVSPFSGIGMKAVAGSHVIGLAQTDFNQDSQGSVTRTVTDKKGKKKDLTVGYVRLNISIMTQGKTAPDDQNSLQRVARGLTGHDVSTLRIVVSLAVAIIALLILVTLIYASIYGSIISIGRNPLAKNAVFRTLSSVLGMALLTTVTAGVIIFFLLR